MNSTKENYIVLINSELKKYLISINKKEKKRLQDKFEFLENGLWDSGLKVKKLKGVSKKVVFEGRLSKSDRILFTLGKHNYQTGIYIWGVVKHDDISSKAQTIVPENAPFLNFESTEIKDYDEIVIDDLPEETFTQERIDQRSNDDSGPQKWLVVDDDQWQRILLSKNTDNIEISFLLTKEQQALLESNPPLLVSGTAGSGKTTLSVYYLFHKKFLSKKRIFITSSPFLKNFSQGIYNGLLKYSKYEKLSTDDYQNPQFRIFRDILKEILAGNNKYINWNHEVGIGEFQDIYKNHKFFKKYDTELVWEEIRSIIKGAKTPINAITLKKLLKNYISGKLSRANILELEDYLIGLKNFNLIKKIEAIIDKKTQHKNYDDFLLSLTKDEGLKEKDIFVLNEILKILDKKSKNFSEPLLSFEEYLTLGKKRAPNFLFDRKDIYAIAEFYQNYLEKNDLMDEIDLCKLAINSIKPDDKNYKYELIVCDEVQDFSDIQLYLIFKLASNYQNVVFTGDPKQIINPSGFRWEEVKNKFYERGIQVPDVINLSLNFRCVGNIVKFSNSLLDLKQKLIGLLSSEIKEEWKFNGRPPFLIYGIDEELILDKIRPKGAGQIILVRTIKEQKKLKKRLDTELVFTINEAKGLEFHTVILWNFSQDKKASELWRKIQNENYFDQSHYPHIRHEINLLYVAVTRARNTLIIYDGFRISDIWEIQELKNHLYKTSEESALKEIKKKTSTPSEWEEQGDYFFDRQHFSAALECYKNADNVLKIDKTRAYILEQQKKYEKAALLFEKNKDFERAALNYEKGTLYDKALILWQKLNDKQKAGLCQIRLFEKEKKYDLAAEHWFMIKDFDNARQNWERAKNYNKLADLHIYQKNYKLAAENFEKAGQNKKAAIYYKKINNHDKASDLFYKSGDLHGAIEIYKQIKDHEKTARLYLKLGDHKNALIFYKKIKDKGKIIDCLYKIEDYYEIAIIYEKDKDFEKAIDYFIKFINISDANRDFLTKEASTLEKKNKKINSAIRFSALTMYNKSAPVYFARKFYDLAIKEFEILNDANMVVKCYRKKGQYYNAACAAEKTDNAKTGENLPLELIDQFVTERGHNDSERILFIEKEGDKFFNEKLYEKALLRYQSISSYRKIYNTFLKMQKDEKAIKFFLEFRMFTWLNGYLTEKENLVIADDFLVRILKANEYIFISFYETDHEKLDVISGITLKYLEDNINKAIIDIINNCFQFKEIFFIDIERLPGSYIELILKLKNYNMIFEIIYSKKFYKDNPGSEIEDFLARIKKISEEENDKNLLACYHYFYDFEKYSDSLNHLPFHNANFRIFKESAHYYLKVADQFVANNGIEEAVRLCRSFNNFGKAGQILENCKDFKEAGKHYRDGKMYKDALRCYQIINDETGMARVYERMKNFDKAINIWKKLKKTTEIKRVRKKWEKEIASENEQYLF